MYCIINKVHHKSKVYAIVAAMIQKRNAEMVDRRSPVTLHRESKGKEKIGDLLKQIEHRELVKEGI